MKKFFKVVFISLASLIVLFILSIMLFTSLAPQMGAAPSGAHLEKIQSSPQYDGEQFVNLVETVMDMGFSKIMGTMGEYMNKKDGSPAQPLPVKFGDGAIAEDTALHITWFGHSAFLLEYEGKHILLDPMLGPAAAPVNFMTKRFPYERPFSFDMLPAHIDAIIFSHDHYDHLDYVSIKKLQDRTEHFFVPLGLGSHLRHWGVSEDKITEMDWWDTSTYKDLELVATPARHFSGRGLTDRNKTLWASWVIKGQHHKIYFSGDGGYADHFREIGEKYGPFDFTMMECGQYHQNWAQIHMMPEQSLQAHLDLKGNLLMPIHWGSFDLALHTWIDPAERILAAAEKEEVQLLSPMIGERFTLGKDFPSKRWWRDLK